MTKKEQIKFCKELIKNVEWEILSKSSLFPIGWDGRELRRYIADCFRAATLGKLDKRREKNYNNDLITSNL